ncbi:MAG: hypothetical protein HDS65_03630 [Bacteroidales bacterium]|nr:hypothetical protein [Bacteroidales bacterium]
MIQLSEANYTDLGYQLRLNYSDLTAEVVISGLKTPDGTSYPTFSLKDIKWTVEEGSKIVVKGTDLVPEMSGFAAKPVFNTFRLELVNRTVDGTYFPGVSMTYTLNGRYSIVSSYADQLLLAKTTSVSDGGEAFSTVSTQYVLNFNMATNRLKITLKQAKFVSGMPAMDIVFDNIPFTFSGNNAVWHVDALTPMLNGNPFAAFPITDLDGSLDFCGNFRLDFICDPATMPGKYDVKAEGSFSFLPEA